MEQLHDPSNQVPPASVEFGDVRNAAEDFRTLPNATAAFGTRRNDAEGFRTLAQLAERRENHTLTVREAARLFEAAGVARTERSIVNWCQPNRTGIARLDSYFDPNERKYFISPPSVESAIAEEKAKAAKSGNAMETLTVAPPRAAASATVPNTADRVKQAKPVSPEDADRLKHLEQENMDLQIMNQGKDFLIDHLKTERSKFFEELLTASRKVGELEAKLLRIAPSVQSPMAATEASDSPAA